MPGSPDVGSGRDAEALGEAVQRPRIGFVPLKEVDQQGLQLLAG